MHATTIYILLSIAILMDLLFRGIKVWRRRLPRGLSTEHLLADELLTVLAGAESIWISLASNGKIKRMYIWYKGKAYSILKMGDGSMVEAYYILLEDTDIFWRQGSQHQTITYRKAAFIVLGGLM